MGFLANILKHSWFWR